MAFSRTGAQRYRILAQTDLMTQWSWFQYRILHPVGILRSLRSMEGNRWDGISIDAIPRMGTTPMAPCNLRTSGR